MVDHLHETSIGGFDAYGSTPGHGTSFLGQSSSRPFPSSVYYENPENPFDPATVRGRELLARASGPDDVSDGNTGSWAFMGVVFVIIALGFLS